MNAIDFIRAIESDENDRQLRSWSREMQLTMADMLVRLQPHLSKLSEEDREAYWIFLEEILSLFPEGRKLPVPERVREELLLDRRAPEIVTRRTCADVA